MVQANSYCNVESTNIWQAREGNKNRNKKPLGLSRKFLLESTNLVYTTFSRENKERLKDLQ